MARKASIATKAKQAKNRIGVIAVVAIVAFLMTFEKVAVMVANLFGTSSEAIRDLASSIWLLAIGVTAIQVGLVLQSVPVVGTVLGGVVALAGLSAVVIGSIRLWNKYKPNAPKIKDGPDL